MALVVGSGREPVAALRALAAGDPALRVLVDLADRLHAGQALPDALHACRLLDAGDAADLGMLPGEALPDALGRLAQQAARPSMSDLLARWFPLWAVLAASVPSLVIGFIVLLGSGACYRGFYASPYALFGFVPAPSSHWWFDPLVVLVVLVLMTLWWWLLRLTPGLRLVTVFSHARERAARTIALLWAARAGRVDERRWQGWADWCGDRQARAMAEGAGGDAAAALVALGVLPRRADGSLDWDAALADQERARVRTAATSTPLLTVALAGLLVHGLVTWGGAGLADARDLTGWLGLSGEWEAQASHSVSLAINLIVSTFAALVAVHALGIALALLRLVAGAARDWPLVADRIARAIERRDDVDNALRGLRLTVGGAMRRRLQRSLALAEALPGRRLVAVGVVPNAQASAISAADAADLPALLRAAGEPVADHGLRAACVHAALLTLATIVILGATVPVATRYESLVARLGPAAGEQARWAAYFTAGQWYVAGALAAALFLALGHACGVRRGWWTALGGWNRLARGLVLRRLLAQGADEAACARACTALPAAQRNRVRDAAARGDLPALMAHAGWQASTPAVLDRVIAATLIARDRRRACVGVAARLVLPVLTALPIALMLVGIFGSVMAVRQQSLSASQGGADHFGGSAQMPTLIIIRWMVERSEAQGQAAIDLVRPPPPSPVIAPGAGP